MTYRDFGGATAVFDRRGRRGLLIFDEDPVDQPTIGDCRGWVAYEVGPQFERLSSRTTWEHAKAVIGPLYDGRYQGPNIPVSYRDQAADLDVILSKLAASGLLP